MTSTSQRSITESDLNPTPSLSFHKYLPSSLHSFRSSTTSTPLTILTNLSPQICLNFNLNAHPFPQLLDSNPCQQWSMIRTMLPQIANHMFKHLIAKWRTVSS